MTAVKRWVQWLLGSRLRIAGALGALALVAVGLVVLRGDEQGGEQVDASALDVRAGTSSTTRPSRDATSATTGAARTPRPRRGPVHIITKQAREQAARNTPRTLSKARRHTRPTTGRSSSGPAPAPTPTPTTAPPPAPSSTTTTTTPAQPVENGRIVFVDASGADATTRIAVMDADGGNVTPLTDGAHVDSHPAWSPDGSLIAFDRVESGARRVFVMTAAGADVHQATSTGGSSANPTWSPDGTKLALVVDGTDVAVVDIASGTTTVVAGDAAAEDAVVAWSPDGSLLAWGSPAGISVAAPDGSGRRQLTTGDDHDPAWSPDGSRLLVRRGTGVVTVDRSGAVSGPIAEGDLFTDLEWSPDGQTFLYDCPDGLCERHIDGSARRVVTANATDADWLAAPRESSTTTTSSTSSTSTTTTSTTQP